MPTTGPRRPLIPSESTIWQDRRVKWAAVARMERLAADAPLLCRSAVAADRTPVMQLLMSLGTGDDYIPDVWDSWLLDGAGLLAVAEQASRIVGQGHLADLGLGEWWLEGLRVRPEVQGQGIGSHLHDYFTDRWRETDGRVVRLATNVERSSVHKMCERTGFSRLTAFARLEADCPSGDPGRHLRPIEGAAPAVLAERLAASPATKALAGLLDLGWCFAEASADRLAALAARRQLWWLRWRGQQGILLLQPGRRPRTAQLVGLDLPLSALGEVVPALLRWGHHQGLSQLTWLAPLADGWQQAAEAAGLGPAGSSFYIYQRGR